LESSTLALHASAVVKSRPEDYLGNGACDSENNNAACGFDSGDCCSCTCVVSAVLHQCRGDKTCDASGPAVYARFENLLNDSGVVHLFIPETTSLTLREGNGRRALGFVEIQSNHS